MGLQKEVSIVQDSKIEIKKKIWQNFKPEGN